ncbi:MAG: HDOD domain-containing protein [Psychrosphaera sp.]|nr:HDOD domain-containing protein [Psychrosphaera sp.]
MNSPTAFYDVLLRNDTRIDDKPNDHERDILRSIDIIINDSYNLNTHIPILPGVFSELWHELNCEHTDFTIIARILKKDPILKAKILTLVNSAYYKRTKKEITEIERAIALIGLETISAIFVTFVIKNAVNINPTHYKIFGKLAWQHMLETAILSQHFSSQYGADNRFLCYLMGLVHDLGKVIIFRSMSDQWQQQMQMHHLGSSAFKKALTKRANALSLYVIEDWPLPKDLVFAVTNYYKGDMRDPYTQVLKVANTVSELHLQIEANMINLKDAHEHLIECGLTWEQSCACLEVVNNIPPM